MSLRCYNKKCSKRVLVLESLYCSETCKVAVQLREVVQKISKQKWKKHPKLQVLSNKGAVLTPTEIKTKYKSNKKKSFKVKWLDKKDLVFRLQTNPPKSDKWFQSIWKPISGDQFNVLFLGFIPDCVNHTYKYVIEIDGSIHRLQHVKENDGRKNKAFKDAGYEVFRIKAFNKRELDWVTTNIYKYIRNKSITPPKAKIILRKQSA